MDIAVVVCTEKDRFADKAVVDQWDLEVQIMGKVSAGNLGLVVNDSRTCKTIRDAAIQAGMTDQQLWDACREVLATAQPSSEHIIQTIKAFGEAAEEPRDKLKRKLFGGD